MYFYEKLACFCRLNKTLGEKTIITIIIIPLPVNNMSTGNTDTTSLAVIN